MTTAIIFHVEGEIDHASLLELLDDCTLAIGRHAYGHVEAATIKVEQIGKPTRELAIPNAAGRNERGFRTAGGS